MSSLRIIGRAGYEPGTPLWQRVPVRDTDGTPLQDFMMLIPGLGRGGERRRSEVIRALQALFQAHGEQVVFADLNMKLSLLWVSMRPHPDGCLALAAAIKLQVPEAVLVANRAEALSAARSRRRFRFVPW